MTEHLPPEERRLVTLERGELVDAAGVGARSMSGAGNDFRGLPFHPLADVFPLLDGDDFAELVADISRPRGVREAIWIYQGKILDGRNRCRAAEVAGVPCPGQPYEGDDPVGFVVSMNLLRRHLDTSQRAMAAAKLANMRQGERTDLPSFEGKPISQGDAAKLFNVGVSSVERARFVREQGTANWIEAVERGDISVSGAAEQIRRGIITGVAMHPYAIVRVLLPSPVQLPSAGLVRVGSESPRPCNSSPHLFNRRRNAAAGRKDLRRGRRFR
jgi:hypothetical protein